MCLKLNEYTSIFSAIFMKNNFCDFLFASERGRFLKEKICSQRSKFFPSRVDPHFKGMPK